MIYTDGTYLLADSVGELRNFARKINLPDENLNDTYYFPHYPINSIYWEKAIMAGVWHVSTEELYHIAKGVYDS